MLYKKVVGSVAAVAAVFLFLQAQPAHAYWLGVPQSLKVLWQNVLAQEGGGVIREPAQNPTTPNEPTKPPTMFTEQDPTRDRPIPSPSPSLNPEIMRDIQREGFKMERDVGQFERMMGGEDNGGQPMDGTTRERLMRVKEGVNNMQRVGGPEDMKGVDINQMDGDMNNLEQERRDQERQQREMKDLQRGVKDMGRGLKDFETQANRLAKKGIQLPTAVSENLSKAKAIIEAVKNAKNFDEARDAGMEDMQDVMQSLNESRQQLEMLARWPQMLKDMDRQLAQLQRELKRAKSTVDRLAKKGMDVGSVYSKFEESINKLKATRNEADQKVKAGEAEDAMSLVQDDFFGQMEDVWEGKKIIDMMSNLGRFNSEFKRGVAQADQQIKRLARRKLDVTELKAILDETKQKGQAVIDSLKSGDIDEEEIMSMMQEMEDMRQKFEEEVANLTGEEETQPWEKGPQQFKAIQMAPGMTPFMKREPAKTCAPGTVCDEKEENNGKLFKRGNAEPQPVETVITAPAIR